MKASQDLKEFVADLIKEANIVAGTTQQNKFAGRWIGDNTKLMGFACGCRLLVAKLGPFGQVWDKVLETPQNTNIEHFERLRGALTSIESALAKGRLASVDELVSAEVLGDLLDHAEELLKSKYNLAAAVILRAVLEERLRKLCESNGCMPTAQRPTIEHFKQALYAAQIIDKLVVKDIDWMAGVGNAAAHRLAEYKDEDIPLFHQRLVAFLTRFSAV